MKSLAHKQTTTHPSSHDEDGACEGGRNGYPSDHQAALNKLHVGLSDNRDRAEETLGSETSGPVSGRTSLKKRSEASRYSGRNGDDGAGPSDGDATFGAQRGASLMGASHLEVECGSEDSDVEKSSTEYADFPRTWGSEVEQSHISDDSEWQYCDSVVAVKRRQSRTLELGRCRFFKSVSVFGFLVGFFKSRYRFFKISRYRFGFRFSRTNLPLLIE